MKKIKFHCVFFIVNLSILNISSFAQRPNYSEDIAKIIYDNCTVCHRPGEIAPMPFTNYQQVSAYANTIESVTSIKYMPPWTPDPNYRHFLDERGLTNQEIQLIKDWVTNGVPQGNPSLEPPLPQFPTGSQLGTPDLVLSFAQEFTHQGNNQDQYQIMVLPSNLTQDKDIAAIEFRPGNKKIAHHAILALDTTGQARILDAQTPEYGYEGFGGFGFNALDINWATWVPGTNPTFSPMGIGRKLYKNSDVLIQMHYAPSPILEKDSSYINIFYSKNPVNRYVSTAPLNTPLNLTNGPFVIGPNQIKTFHSTYSVPIDASLLSIGPHCHLLGKSWEVFAIKPTGDTIPLIKMDEWDFNWQGSFNFKKLIPIPAGSVIHAFGEYDNTINNPNNPNNPPQFMTWGESTNEEMFLVYFSFVPYRIGDENITLSNDNIEGIVDLTDKLYPVFPNPSNSEITIGFNLSSTSALEFMLYDLQGKEVLNISDRKNYFKGHHQKQIDISNLESGTYLIRIKTKKGFTNFEKLVIY